MDAPPLIMSPDSRVFGHVPGVSFGDTFETRQKVRESGVHAPTQAGIHGDSSPDGGAFSICISGGYEDDDDKGDKLTYVGSGGQRGGEQLQDQTFDDPRNQSLLVSSQTKRPVRVIRGPDKSNHWAPADVYDGLYVVDSAKMKLGKAGHMMCTFELSRIKEESDGHIPYKSITIGQLKKKGKATNN